jgi:hypothetical protein
MLASVGAEHQRACWCVGWFECKQNIPAVRQIGMQVVEVTEDPTSDRGPKVACSIKLVDQVSIALPQQMNMRENLIDHEVSA